MMAAMGMAICPLRPVWACEGAMHTCWLLQHSTQQCVLRPTPLLHHWCSCSCTTGAVAVRGSSAARILIG